MSTCPKRINQLVTLQEGSEVQSNYVRSQIPDISLSKLKVGDLRAVDVLMKRHSQTLGFLPMEALREYLAKGRILGAKDNQGQLAGYLLYYSSSNRFRIVHLCVSESFRGLGVARCLLEMLKGSVTTQSHIKLDCRRDFSANSLWPKLGFVPINEKPGRSLARLPLTTWYLALDPALQMDLGLFQASTSDDTLDVIIDAQVFFDLFSDDSNTSEPSKALLADFLVDSLNLWVTDELFNEVDRNKDPAEREEGRKRLQRFPQVTSSPRRFDDSYSRLKAILPHSKVSQDSDVRQLAKAASSDVHVFVTRDEALLKKAQDIADLTNLRVISPTELIIQLHELLERQSYGPERVSGLRLGWHRITSNDLASFPFDSFLNEGERLGKFKEDFNRFLANPEHYESELLKSEDNISAVRILDGNSNGIMTVRLARIAASTDKSLFGRFLIADTVARAITRDVDMVRFPSPAVTSSLMPDLLEMGFVESNDYFEKFCFSHRLEREEVQDRITQLSPASRDHYQNMSNLELERHCSPLVLTQDQNHFLVPIRPGYALSLIDRYQSSGDLFGGDPNVLLRWDNVYYRKATMRETIKAPAKLLWYVSGSQGQIVAVSLLDEVAIATPEELLKRYKKFGVFGWADLYKMCKGDTSVKLMALKFSHTTPFRRRIHLKEIRKVYDGMGKGLSLRSISRISPEAFEKLFGLGFSNT